jgi:hypothetical protein
MAVVSLAGRPANAIPTFEGTPDFSIFIQSADPEQPVSRESVKILAAMSGSWYPAGAKAQSEILLGPSLEWKSGDRVHTGHPSDRWQGTPDRLWPIELRALKNGSTYLRATFSARVSVDRTDEMVIELPLLVQAEGVRFGVAHVVRAETIRKGQRYRFAGMFLVPIDAPEEVVSPDIIKRARVTYQAVGHCTDCDSGHYELPFVAFVTARGSLRSFRYLSNYVSKPDSPMIVQAAERSLRQWKFAPARTKNRPVSDWVLVKVPVDSQ